MIKQRTPKKVIQATGVGLHSGDKVLLTLRPAPINTGIVFRRIDLSPVVEIPASYEYVCDTMLCTSLQRDGVKVATVEHLLSAFAGLGIDNAYVDINAPEIPIMDGSAAPFVFLIQSAGIREQSAAKRFIRILKPIRIEEKDKYVQFLPYNGYKVSFTIDFEHPVFNDRPQTAQFDFSTTSYVKEVCRARTFGFLSDYEKLRENDLAKGGSLDNAIVVDDYRVLNEDGLRFEDEFVKHKVLDAIGDLYLLGSGLIGAFEGYKSGHELNNKLLRELMVRQEAWEYTYFDAETYLPSIQSVLLPIEA
ncbi:MULTISPECIES: UDP-3-O-acyl-N-acetylglucosamine deacetylase [Legionella]|uniref:UDP-3-O-acyl-N-acetylglucosamine deacetylase n=1 Tax=Legionella septentrionalis TaxID=2498109 RepID=A0A3S0WSU2_9GAMM|nr:MULTISPECIES: UDP-3-O-acyl-N-acetylglucosamine deacetylase [Legionella]MCP0913966.1 UDP-3-O-acyl-N-acetylglucosamine deacetylase [Legionella sp. 27cVA30]RUQ90376.1 UDP-3-O-acyl-N-acetylglucosamine deacetylase [Legionella septentrionalis]RUR00027.1 UDP-3-O-acyl-N-acetylglucosamine deacetylase [Legionella septentrionalis]RUR10723.1 UDP-3-O-acyl-N-acetylglucosamine deacetylase [Legionella septentrionalis]RUR16524.1 UDP-3-O-acyl-N-acetylglucosamine deacetylase [Legionella septentrionalis]